MKYLLLFIQLFSSIIFSQENFLNYFENKQLRIDYFHTGDHKNDSYSLDELKEEPYWGGNKFNLIDKFDYGKYKVEVFDSASNKLIFSKGYSTLFGEWQTTDEAEEVVKSFSETVLMPYPKKTIKVVFNSRNKKGEFENKFNFYVDPENYFISTERKFILPLIDIHKSGDPDTSVDIVIIPDGYTETDMSIFEEDCIKFKNYLFNSSPFKENKNKFNISAVKAVSIDSGSDIPAENIWKKTAVNTSYYTFDSERYLMTTDNKTLHDIAANTYYDQIYILVNSNKYGGGAIYNHYSVCVNNNVAEEYIFVHEFGHGFAGLGDEYYTSDVSYENFYPADIEPWEPNLTTLVDFESKWKDELDKNVKIPTPVNDKTKNMIGVFEGGGYVAKNVYRPEFDCTMKSISIDNFCKVCNKAIQNMINFHSASK